MGDEDFGLSIVGLPVVYRDNDGAQPIAAIVTEGTIDIRTGKPAEAGRVNLSRFVKDETLPSLPETLVMHRDQPARQPRTNYGGDPRYWEWHEAFEPLIEAWIEKLQARARAAHARAIKAEKESGKALAEVA